MKITTQEPQGPQRRRGTRRLRTIAVFPTMLTLGNMLCGFAAIYLCVLGVIDTFTDVQAAAKQTLGNRVIEDLLPTYVSVAGFLIFLGMFFDMMDGRVARMTSGTTNFGGQLDSLADMVTFGLAPAVLVIVMTVCAVKEGTEGVLVSARMSWVAGAIYTSCCALRLARFNVEHADGDLKHTSFYGLPSPAAAAVVASLVILYEHVAEVKGLVLLNVLPVVAIATGLLMVSRVRYVHVGNTYLRGRRPFGHVAIMVVIAGMFIRFPSPMLAVLAGGYALMGPIGHGVRRVRRSSKRETVSSGLDDGSHDRSAKDSGRLA